MGRMNWVEQTGQIIKTKPSMTFEMHSGERQHVHCELNHKTLH